MKIGIDLDNVLNTYDECFFNAYIQKYGCLTISSDEEMPNIFSAFTRAEFISILVNMKVKDNAYSVTKQLIEQGHELYVVTSTYPENIKFKEGWLKRNLPHLDNLIMTKDKNMINIDLLIDDSLEHIEAFRGQKIVFNNLSNKSYPVQHYRAFDWNGVLDIINNFGCEIKGLSSYCGITADKIVGMSNIGAIYDR